MAGNNGVTIIKRKKVAGGDGHHGGAWKVAYADFVTAMMAFFLLMWLLNATTEEQRKGLAEYFDPTVPVSRVSGGGSGALGGDSVFTEETLARNGTGGSARSPAQARQARGERGTTASVEPRPEGAAEELTELDALFRGMSGESERADPLMQHIRTRVTDEGLVIELFDVDGAALFEVGSARPTPRMRALLEMVGETAAMVTNRVAVEGHTDSRPFAGDGYSNWELSADRANAARRALTAAGIAPERMARVVGKADRDPAEPEDPASARNRRVAITLLRADL
jgi:chemotaxis protein MotB